MTYTMDLFSIRRVMRRFVGSPRDRQQNRDGATGKQQCIQRFFCQRLTRKPEETIRGFPRDDIGVAKYYDFDKDFLLEPEACITRCTTGINPWKNALDCFRGRALAYHVWQPRSCLKTPPSADCNSTSDHECE
jgi:hypothetical protein